jgi:hypothetical protein
VRNGPAEDINILSPWPVPRPATWLDDVNRPQSNRSIREIEDQIRRQRRTGRGLNAWRTHPD